jgi:hypothetical protein
VKATEVDVLRLEVDLSQDVRRAVVLAVRDEDRGEVDVVDVFLDLRGRGGRGRRRQEERETRGEERRLVHRFNSNRNV